MKLPEYRIRRATTPVTVDGRLDEPAWDLAEEVQLLDNQTCEAPKQATTVKLLWDDGYLYAGFECEDTDAWSTYTEHDEPLYEQEVVEMFIDPSGLLRTYFELQVSPRNVGFDSFILNDGGERGKGRGPNFQGMPQWTCHGMRHEVVCNGDPTRRGTKDDGWTVELAIPLIQLISAPHVPPIAGDVWRANIYRIDHAADYSEFSAWSPTGMRDFHVTEAFGRLIFEG